MRILFLLKVSKTANTFFRNKRFARIPALISIKWVNGVNETYSGILVVTPCHPVDSQLQSDNLTNCGEYSDCCWHVLGLWNKWRNKVLRLCGSQELKRILLGMKGRGVLNVLKSENQLTTTSLSRTFQDCLVHCQNCQKRENQNSSLRPMFPIPESRQLAFNTSTAHSHPLRHYDYGKTTSTTTQHNHWHDPQIEINETEIIITGILKRDMDASGSST